MVGETSARIPGAGVWQLEWVTIMLQEVSTTQRKARPDQGQADTIAYGYGWKWNAGMVNADWCEGIT